MRYLSISFYRSSGDCVADLLAFSLHRKLTQLKAEMIIVAEESRAKRERERDGRKKKGGNIGK